MTRVFIHGLESSSQGTKGQYFRSKFPHMIIEDYTGSLKNRMAKLNAVLAGKTDLILVGSSYGGLMAAMYACAHPEKVKKLILLAPALNLAAFRPYLKNRLTMPTILYQGRHDDVVPPAPVREIAGRLFSDLQYHLVDDDHPLTRSFETLNWDALLEAPVNN
ncbi:MAG: alpha/beta hydrolase [Deltaproteobacteria bacterium]|nr:alpha/beta hydrolase [Deltaproteobacteria bacterium]